MVQFRPLRVALDAHVVGRRQTGNETYIVNLANALASRSDVEPIIFADRGVKWPGSIDVPIRRLWTRTPFIRIPLELPVRAHHSRADLLHVQYVAPPISSTPIVTTIHDLSFEDVPGFFPRPTQLRLRTLVRMAARHSRAVLTVSGFTRDRLVDQYGVEPERVFVTPNGVASWWQPLSEEELDRRLGDLHLPAVFVLAVGDLHPRKNIGRLIKSVATIRKSGAVDVHVVLAGQRAWRATEVDAAIRAVDGRSWVRSLGYVHDHVLQALYGAAKVVAYPSLYEGFGLPALEALACGAVLVAANTSAIPEVVGDAAILVDPIDETAITNGLVRAMTDAALRQRLTTAGPIQAAYFTWTRCANATVRAYHAAAGVATR